MRTTGGLIGFLRSKQVKAVKDPDFNEIEFEKLLKGIFQVSERPPTMVILRGVLYDLKKKRQKEKARRVWNRMMKEAKA